MGSRRDVRHCCASTSTRSTAGTADHAGSRHTRRRSHPSVHNSTARRQTHPVRVAGVLPQACRRTGVTRRGSAVDLMERQHARVPRILGRLRPEGRRPRHQARARSVPPLVQVPLPLYCAVHTRGATLTAVHTLRTRTPPVHSYAASSSCSRAPSPSGARLVEGHLDRYSRMWILSERVYWKVESGSQRPSNRPGNRAEGGRRPRAPKHESMQ